MMCAPVHACDDGIGRARQLVMQAAFNQAAQHGISDLSSLMAKDRILGVFTPRGIAARNNLIIAPWVENVTSRPPPPGLSRHITGPDRLGHPTPWPLPPPTQTQTVGPPMV